MPTISVVVPVYKVEPYIHRCIDSILAQTYTDFELILVDDGSPDNCGAVCDEYAEKDNRIRVIHKENGGVSSARNAGIDWTFANSDSEWLYFVDSDDWVHPECLKIMLNAVKESRLNIAVAEYARVKQPYEKVPSVFSGYRIESSVSVYTKNFTSITAYPWAKLFAKHLWREVRFPIGKRYEDLAVTYKVMLPEKNVAYVESTLYYYFVSPHSQGNDSWEDYYWALDQHYADPLVTENKRLLSFILMVDVKACCHDCARIVSSKKYSPQEKRNYFHEQVHRAFAIVLHRWSDITKEDKKRFVRDLFVSLRNRIGHFARR